MSDIKLVRSKNHKGNYQVVKVSPGGSLGAEVLKLDFLISTIPDSGPERKMFKYD